MFNLSDCTSLKGFCFPRSVIGYAVWAYHRFALSLRDVEDLLASCGIRAFPFFVDTPSITFRVQA